MELEAEGNGYRLSSGRVFYANRGLIGIKPTKDGEWEISEGYDGHVDVKDYYDVDTDLFASWTPAERAELANYMIGLWLDFQWDSLQEATV